MLFTAVFTLIVLGRFHVKAQIDAQQFLAFSGFNGTKTFLVRIEYYNVESANSNVTKPPEPTTRGPIQSTTTGPIKSTTGGPIQSTTGGSTKSTTGKPIKSTTGKPIQSTTEGSTKSTTGKPIQPGGDKCKLNNGMNDGLREVFLSDHNRLRSMTAKGLAENPLGTNRKAPKAARMLKMIYDCKIEESAANHAKKCVFQHSSGSGNGENLWVMWPAQKNLTQMAISASQSWFDELKKYGVPPDNKLTEELWNRPKMAIGHYTAMVWEGTYKLGCGIATCPDKTLITCQYSPSGNWMGNVIYTIGEPCKTDDDCKCDGCKCSRDEALCIKPN